MRHRARRVLAALVAAGLLLQPAGVPAVHAQAESQPALEIEAPSAVLIDVLSGRVLFEKNPHERRYPASITKLMTMYVTLRAIRDGRVHWDDDVVASERAASMGGTQIFLAPGEVMKLRDLFKSVAIASANDAAVAVAEHVAGSVEDFVALMNQAAAELGMRDTHFANPHGLHDPDHYSSAHDIALLSRALLLEFPQVLEFTRVWIDYVREGEKRFQLANTNKMVAWYKGVDGLKTGWHSEAGWCVAATMQEGDTRLVAVILGHEHPRERFADAAALLRYGFSRYEAVPVATKGEVIRRVRVYEGPVGELEAVAAETLGVLVPRGGSGELTRELALRDPVTAPVRKGESLGALVVRHGDQEVGRVEIVASADVPRLGLAGLMARVFTRFWPFGR